MSSETAATNDKLVISPGTVELLLKDGDTVHTFLSAPGALIGADWQRADLLALVTLAGDAEIGGPQCMKVGHGVVIHRQSGPSPLFCAHNKARMAAFVAGDDGWNELPGDAL